MVHMHYISVAGRGLHATQGMLGLAMREPSPGGDSSDEPLGGKGNPDALSVCDYSTGCLANADDRGDHAIS